MKIQLLLICSALALSACDSVKDTPARALDNVGDNVGATWNKTREYLGVGHKAKKPVHSQARYCYRSYEDITCYSEPVPGQENRLVAYQGSSGQTGYVMPQITNQSTAPVSLPPLKAVTIGPPPLVKGVDAPASPEPKKKNDKQLKEIIFDPAELKPKELVPQKAE